MPPWWAILLYVVLLAAMLALGRWQLVRADEKIALLDRAAAARAAAPVAIGSLTDEASSAEAAASYRRVDASGTWLSERQFLWDNRAHAGRPGFEVITPLMLDDGRVVLVNRGWRPLATRRDVLPQNSIAQTGASVDGLFSRPSRGFARGDAFDADAPWPRYLQYFDFQAIEGALEQPLIAGVLQPAEDQLGAWRYEPNWQPAASGPGKHYSYAVQWFAMAFALTIIMLVVNRRTPERGADPRKPDFPETR